MSSDIQFAVGPDLAPPISQLPDEILCKIFSDAQEYDIFSRSSEMVRKFRSWLAVTHVCVRWRNAALACSALWGRLITNAAGPEWLKAMTERSKQCSISVRIDADVLEHEKAIRGMLLRPSRLRALRMYGGTASLQQALALLKVPATQLEELNIAFPSLMTPGKSIFPDNFLANHAPKLQRLTLTNCDFPWHPSPRFDNLTTLNITHYANSLHPPPLSRLQVLLDALAEMPNLVELNLQQFAVHRARAQIQPKFDARPQRQAGGSRASSVRPISPA
ncbi:hypothetical protein CC1G_10755 [Coprinopsis cinerea okayama7|uniref:F-box domain-containing protein n=1 Tax=Coprinopsis cinerea (strain Okayama-7 / 130 / ATCC MYA-4618 / FGSC 9003) TaxID=240176 RepID=A8P3B4_COPC7|nr:hypothetical protein CC1G_10755 [Coprinopsis cinerea okayama7\|eukprot:XP_001838513.1 hypothetical protein CC1G_10755 [Coprinopsis cinerea okayama7\